MFSGKICPGVAAFGMVKRGDKLIIFGGMVEYQIYTNVIYTLELNTWHWSKITNAIGEPPRARIGHSLTAIDDHKIFMFGGIINVHRHPEKYLNPRFTNDLFILHTHNKNKFAWEEVITENGPIGRESHSAIFYHNKIQDKNYLIIFGGMNGERLNDLWFLDVDEFIWMQFDIKGSPPEPRSLHTASLVGSQMIIFGGWTNDVSNNENKENNANFKSTNSIKVLDLDCLEWKDANIEGKMPPPRAGHSAVVFQNRIYICSGRSTYRFIQDNPAPCHDDFWFLELSAPAKVEKIEMNQCTPKSIDIKWNRVGNANCYLVEIRRVQELTSNLLQTIKLVKNVNQTSIAEKRKSDAPPSTAKKVIIINPMKAITFQQVDGCNDENFNVKEEITADKIKKETPTNVIKASEPEKSWCTVGVFKNNTHNVDGYFSFTFPPDFNDDMCPQNIMLPKIELYPNTMYAFRIAGINSCGIGEFSKMIAFRTLAEGLPAHPSNLKFIPMHNALRLCWNPSQLEDRVNQYFAFIGVKANDSVNFNRIYCGNQPTCTVSYELLKKPEYQVAISKENQSKHFIFRIRAMNDKGLGPFLQATYNAPAELLK